MFDKVDATTWCHYPGVSFKEDKDGKRAVLALERPNQPLHWRWVLLAADGSGKLDEGVCRLKCEALEAADEASTWEYERI